MKIAGTGPYKNISNTYHQNNSVSETNQSKAWQNCYKHVSILAEFEINGFGVKNRTSQLSFSSCKT